MAVFEHCSMLLELKTLPFKEKKKLKSSVTENGGRISFMVNKQCSLIVTSDVSLLSSNRLRSIQRHQTPVVGLEYVYSCLERGLLLPVDDYRLDASPPAASSPPLPRLPPPLARQEFKAAAAEPPRGPAEPADSAGPSQRATGGEVRDEPRIYSGTDSDLTTFPENFQVAKYSIFEKVNSNTWCVLELQSCRAEAGRQYRVVQYWKDNIFTKAAAPRDTLVILSTSEEALQVYKAQRETLQATGLQLRTNTPPQAQHLGSAPFQQLLLEEKLNTGSLSQEVGVFVELLWTEALGHLGSILRVPIDKLSLNDVSRVEGLLLEAQRKLREASPDVESLLSEVYTLLPHMEPVQLPPTAKLIAQKLDLCQLIRDVLNVSEMTLWSSGPSSLGKYRALRCSIEPVAPETSEYRGVSALLQDRKVQVRQVLRVSRGVELQTFRGEVGNIKPLLHSSRPSNFVGVLSRGLLLPRVGVEHYGIERTDVGHLGSGIYFSDAVGTSLKYSSPSDTDGSRLLLVCDVALGRCRDVRHRDATLTQAPEGHHSVHGVRRAPNAHSEFEDDEYVVYSADQVKLKYVVQFSIEGEQVKEFSPAVDTSAEAPPTSDQGQGLTQEDDEVDSNRNRLAEVKAGLMDSSGQQLPLQAVHVKCRLMDLLSQVVIFQTYSNLSSVPIEAKYVFPLDDSAAVCGFEAFINGKHVVGRVKEKEAARREYKQAVEKGHGAYLMDQDAPDVFTISVGNLPPGATVLIKVTFVSELVVRDGSVLFSLPGSVAPWQQSAALHQTTQVSVEKVCVTDEAREFSLDMSVEMPNKITDLQSVTHKVKIKRTDCKAVVSVLPGEVMGQDGFQLSITLSDVHLPRMWVERHPDKDSQASMLVFYPDFEVDPTSAPGEVVLLVDTSESMKGEPLRGAQTIARHVLRTLDHNIRLNVVFFGTDHTEAFLTARPLAEARPAAESFIKRSPPVGGSTELWRPLRALSLLPPSRGVRNLLLLSDGHVQNAELALRLLRDNGRHSRLFTCGLSPTANRHMLRALAQAGGGAYEYFDTKTKHNWAEKVACQLKRMASPGCSSVSVKWQQFNPAAPPPVQAPKQLHALFSDCHTLVYGFVPHCSQATLLGNLSGQELKTMVSTSELQKTKGTFLHKLTARALIRDYEDGSLDSNEAEHEWKKKELKSLVIELSKEFSILSQFTSFVAVEERDPEQPGDGFTDIPKLISEEDVDFLPYISWISPQDIEEEEDMEMDLYEMEEGAELEEDDDDDEEDQAKPAMSSSSDSLPMVEKASVRCLHRSSSPSSASSSFGTDTSTPVYASSSFHPPPRRPPSFPVPQGGVLSSFGSFHPPPPPQYQVLQEPFQTSTLFGHPPPPSFPVSQWPALSSTSPFPPPPPPPRPLYPLFKPISCMTSPGPHGGQSGPPAMLDLGALKVSEGLAVSARGRLVNLFTESSALMAAGTIQRLGGSPFASQQQQQQQQSLQLGEDRRAESEQAPATLDRYDSGFSFCGPQIQFGSLSGFSKLERAQGSPQPDSYLKTRFIGQLGKQTSESLPVGPDRPPQSEPAQSFYQALLKSRKKTISHSRRSEDLSGTAQSSPQPDMFLKDCSYLPMSGDLSGTAQSSPQPDMFLKDCSYLPMSGDLSGTAQSSPQPDMFLKDCSMMQTSQSLPVGPDRPPQSEPAQSFYQALLESQKETCSYFPMSGDLSGTAQSSPQPDMFLKDCSMMQTSQSLPVRPDRLKLRRRSHRNFLSLSGVSERSGDALETTQSSRRLMGEEPLVQGPPSGRDAEDMFVPLSTFHQLAQAGGSAADARRLRWMKIFQMQHSEGYWELTTELGELLDFNVDLFANEFLKNKGIQSLGVRAHTDILRLLATLLVLQLMRVQSLQEGKLLRTLFSLVDPSLPRSARWDEVKRAVDWVCWADRQYPCVYSRLEFGLSWETSTRQLLGFQGLPPFSALTGLKLQRADRRLQVF